MKLKHLNSRNKGKNVPINNKYFVYCRKSSESEDRQMQSVVDQQKVLSSLANKQSLAVKKIFKESKSAKAPGRLVFNEMIDTIKKDESIKGILCWHLNRLSRNPVDSATLQWLLQTGTITDIITPTKIYTEADADLLMSLEGALANRFIRDLRRDTKRGIQAKLDKGQAPVFAPVGYKNNTHKKQGDRDISPHPTYFTLMKKVFDLALTGEFSLELLTEKAKGMGIRNNRGKHISKSQMADILHSPFYAGKFLYAGKLYQGKHKPILTEEEFDLLQDILSGKSRPRKQKHDFPLTGLIRCGECGMMITAESHTKTYQNGKKQTFVYYRCTKKGKHKCTQPYTPGKELESQAVEFLKQIEISEKFSEWAIKWLNESNDDQKEVRENQVKVLQKEHKDVRKKLDNLLELKISPNNTDGILLSDEEFESRKNILVKDKHAIENKLEKLNTGMDDWIDITAKTFDFAARAKRRFEEGGVDDKKIILKAIGSNLYLKDKKLDIQARTPFLLIKNAVNETRKTNKSLEPNEMPVFMEKNGELYPQNPVWGG